MCLAWATPLVPASFTILDCGVGRKMAKNYEVFINLQKGMPLFICSWLITNVNLVSITTLHPFLTSRESIFPVWFTSNQQACLSNPATCTTNLFVLHGMVFTNIQLNDFAGMLAHFLERLEIEGDDIEEHKWIMMRIMNLGAVLEYGRASGIIHLSGGLGMRESSSLGGVGLRVVVKNPTTIIKDKDTKMDIGSNDNSKLFGRIQTSPATSEADKASGSYANKYPASFKLAALITFTILSYILKNPTRRPTPFSKSTLNS